MGIAVLSNINLDPLQDYLKDDYDRVHMAGFNAYTQELLNPSSFLIGDEISTVFFHLDGTELLQPYLVSLNRLEDIRLELDALLSDFFSSIEVFLKNKGKCLFIINTIVINPFMFNGFLEVNSEYSFNEIKQYVNRHILDFRKTFANVQVFDWESVVIINGYEQLFDDKFWFIGRIKYTALAFEQIGLKLRCLVNGYFGKIHKVIVVDLDNTLWGGIIGEDGPYGILLGQEGIGMAYYDFQQMLKSVTKIGIGLAICSKNNYVDVMEVFENNPMMVLRSNDFISIKINWDNKVENIIGIAKDLNLGLESFVFLDDNPVERNLVKEFIPEVAVPEFPSDPADLRRWFIDKVLYQYFPKINITEEDKTKTEQYLVSARRLELSKSYDFPAFLKSLNIKLDLCVNDFRFIQRSAQMTQKTNQFNSSAKKYQEQDIRNSLSQGKNSVFNLKYEDRFGDEGVIGTAIVSFSEFEIFFDSVLLSCRVIGRNVEYSFLSKILDRICSERKEIDQIKFLYVPTIKNVIVMKFFQNLGIEQNNEKECTPGMKIFSSGLDLIRDKLAKILS